MNAERLLSDLVKRDVTVTIRGDHLRIEAPRGVLTEELRSALSKHKPEILQLLRTNPDHIASMTLDEFAHAGLVVRMRSGLLNRDVLFVSDNVPESALSSNNLPTYRACELRSLAILRPRSRTLQSIHQLTSLFHGAITDVRACNDHDPD